MSDEPERYTIELPALKAMAHPLRLQLLTALSERGHATASQLAADLGESSGSTSYHLRQLSKHGFIQDDPQRRGTGRERVWVPRRGGWDLPVFDLMEQPGGRAAIDLVLREQFVADSRREMELIAAAADLSEQWRDTAQRRTAYLSLSAAQVMAMQGELSAVIDRYRALTAGDDARRVFVGVTVLPTEHRIESPS